jgi:hypothetical protein
MSAIHVPSGISIELHIRPDQHSPVYISRAVVCWERESVVGLAFKELSELEAATLTRLLWSLPRGGQDASRHGILAVGMRR